MATAAESSPRISLYTVVVTVFIMSVLSVVGWVGTRFYYNVTYGNDIGAKVSVLKAASTPVLMLERMDALVAAAEARGLTQGSTHILAYSETDDVGLWYRNLVGAQESLRMLPANATLEGSHAVVATVARAVSTGPEGDSVLGHNRLFFAWGLGSLLLAVFTFFLAGDVEDRMHKRRYYNRY